MGAIQNSINSVLGTGAVLAGGAKKLATDKETAKNTAETAEAANKSAQLAQQTFDKNELREAEQKTADAKTEHQKAYNDYVAAENEQNKATLDKQLKELAGEKSDKQKSSEAIDNLFGSMAKEVAFDAQHEGKQLTKGEKSQKTKLASRSQKAKQAFDDLADEQEANMAISLRLKEKQSALESAQTRYKNANDRYNELKADYEKKYGGKKN